MKVHQININFEQNIRLEVLSAKEKTVAIHRPLGGANSGSINNLNSTANSTSTNVYFIRVKWFWNKTFIKMLIYIFIYM